MPNNVVVKVSLPCSVFTRIEAAAAARGISPAVFLATMALWHAPAADNSVQTFKAKIRAIVTSSVDSSDMVDEIEELVGVGPSAGVR